VTSPPQRRKVWLADITYIPTAEGWWYLAAVMDLFSRKIVGWAMRDHMQVELASAALTMAIQQQRPQAGLIHHSDRGVQYASSAASEPSFTGNRGAAALTGRAPRVWRDLGGNEGRENAGSPRTHRRRCLRRTKSRLIIGAL
jgi:transposase InsO family protein